MVWGAISSRSTIKLVIVSNKINAGRYCEMLDNALVPFIEDFGGLPAQWCFKSYSCAHQGMAYGCRNQHNEVVSVIA